MKVLAAILLFATLAQSRPNLRHMLVPYDHEIEQPQVITDIELIHEKCLNLMVH